MSEEAARPPAGAPSTGGGPYAQILRSRGTKAFVVTGTLYRFDLSMTPLGIILMITGRGGSLVHATILTGAVSLAGAFCGPQMSGLADRHGQRRVLRCLGLTYLCAVLSLIGTVLLDAPLWSSICFGLLVGATNPMVSAMVRARWSHLFHGSPSLRTAFALESMIDAAMIALGAPLATFLATAFFPAATLLVAALAAATSAVLLSLQKHTEPSPHTMVANKVRTSSVPMSIAWLLGVLFFVGVYLASFDVATIAVALDAGQQQWAGWVLAAYAIGSTTGGAVIGRLKGAWETQRLLIFVLIVLTVTVVPMLLVQNPMLRLFLGLTAGLAVAPTIILAMTLVETLTPPGLLTGALGWAGSALVTGNAAGQILAGHAADLHNGHGGYAVSLAGAVLALLISLWKASLHERVMAKSSTGS